MKVSLFDKRVLNKFYAFLGAISVITSIVFLFAGIEDKDKPIAGAVALGAILLVYIGICIHANVRRSIRLKINTSEVEVSQSETRFTICDKTGRTICSRNITSKNRNQAVADFDAIEAVLQSISEN